MTTVTQAVRPVHGTLSDTTKHDIAPNTAIAVIGAGAAGVIALWWHDTVWIHGIGDELTNAGRITGLLAGYAIVVLLALMARIPALEHGVGADRLARWHSMGGRYTVSLAVSHTLLIVWGYALTDHRSVLREVITLETTYADMLMATVALGLFVGIGVVSARAVRRKLRYETWYYLHFYTYLAVALAFSHQFSSGADFVDNRLARASWAALYIVVGYALVWYRCVVPVRQAARHRLRVKHVVDEGPNTVSIWMSGAHLDELAVSPGQFFRWRFFARGLWWTTNPYSLSAPVENGTMRITVKNLGDHSAKLRTLRSGTVVFAEGPYGAMTAARRTRRRVLLIAGGVGITPLRTLFERLPGGPGDVALLYRASTPEEVLFRDELDLIATRQQADLRYLVGPRGSRADVFLPGALERVVPDVAHRDVYVCGPAGMTDAARRALRRARVPRRHIHIEAFEF